jgi:hypothetical protein
MIRKIIKNSLKRILHNLQLYTKGEGFIMLILMYYIFPIIRKKNLQFMESLCKDMSNESYSSLVKTLVPFLSFIICLIICVIISNVIVVTFLEIRSRASLGYNGITTVNRNDYTFVSMEDIED